jgi:hypothetical protein
MHKQAFVCSVTHCACNSLNCCCIDAQVMVTLLMLSLSNSSTAFSAVYDPVVL